MPKLISSFLFVLCLLLALPVIHRVEVINLNDWTRWDSNPQPIPCKGIALPFGATGPYYLAPGLGIEPKLAEPQSAVLSFYTTPGIYGRSSWNRTSDNARIRRVLFLLSYTPILNLPFLSNGI